MNARPPRSMPSQPSPPPRQRSRKFGRLPARKSPQTARSRPKMSAANVPLCQRGWPAWAIGLCTTGVMIASGSLLVTLGWLGSTMIVSPQTLLGLNQWIPGLIPTALEGWDPPQSFQQIQTELAKTGRSAGAWLQLGPNKSVLDHRPVMDWLLPVHQQQPNCQTDCTSIVELRIYQASLGQATPTYHLVGQLPIVGLEESFVIGPIVDARSANQGSSRQLPLTNLQRFTGQVPKQGVWLNLQGRWQRSIGTLLYGQVLYYHPDRLHLSAKLDWTTPSQQLPQWQAVTGGGLPELVLNQTTGMEPQFTVYQVTPLNFVASPVQLEPVSLTQEVLSQSRYRTGLMLARSGLWSLGQQWLQTVKAAGYDWSPIAQAQLDVITRHAQVTQQQAKQSWASPSQQILANLMDGRWEQGLDLFEAAVTTSQETAELLRSDRGQLADRIKANLRAEPNRTAVKLWGALLHATQQNPSMALTWLRHQTKPTAEELDLAQRLIQRLNPNFTEQDARRQLGQFWGVAQFVEQAEPDWQPRPGRSPQLQSGYRLRLSHWHGDQGWQTAAPKWLDPTLPIGQLWQRLGLGQDARMELVAWSKAGTPTTQSAQVTALRWYQGNLELWLDASSVPPALVHQPWLVTTPAAFTWVNPDPSTLGEWVLAQPQWAKTVLPALMQHLQQGIKRPVFPPSAPWEKLEALGMGQWPIQLVKLTGSAQPEVIVTVDPTQLTTGSPLLNTALKRPTTLIFQANGRLIYSELAEDRTQQYRAIVDIGQEPFVLLSQEHDRYHWRQWNTKTKAWQEIP